MGTVDMFFISVSRRGSNKSLRAGGSRKPAETAQTRDPAQYAVMTPDNH
jgi:hypothetical protein